MGYRKSFFNDSIIYKYHFLHRTQDRTKIKLYQCVFYIPLQRKLQTFIVTQQSKQTGMNINEKQIVESLKKVLYFPKADNIIALGMLHHLEITNNSVNITIAMPEANDRHTQTVKTAVENTLESDFPNILINIEATYIPPQSIGGLGKVKNIIAIASGKGGVGKSTVATNLALALAQQGGKVGLLDADIYGPSLPIMMGLEHARPEALEQDGKTFIVPIEKYGIKMLSIGFFIDPNKALMWRGSMAGNALQQLFNDAMWGELDYLILDLPPGTGDIHLSLVQSVPVTAAIIVTTPQNVALADVRKAADMFNNKAIKVPVIGVIENMSYFSPPELPDNKYYIFGKGGGQKVAKELQTQLIGQIPIEEYIAEGGDKGEPAVMDIDRSIYKVFKPMAKQVIELINERNQTLAPTKVVEIKEH